jgi:cytidylate kinase
LKAKTLIQIAIDSPAAAGAGTQAKLLALHYNLLYLDTGKIYRFLGNLKLENPKLNYKFIKKKIKILKLKDLNDKKLISDRIAVAASVIAKDRVIRKIVHNFQVKCAYYPPKKYNGSILDGRDITSVIMKDAKFKFFITASTKVRALRRYKELKALKKNITFQDVLKSIKKRDKSDYNRKLSPLKKTKDSILINTSNLTKRACFLKIKKIIDRKLNT